MEVVYILADDESVPLARSGHVAVVWRDHVYLWGGYNHDSNGHEHWIDSKIVWKYNLNTLKWIRYKTQGNEHPPSSVGCGFACVDGKLILFGGCSYDDFNDTWFLHLSKLEWELLEPLSLKPSERNKTACCIHKNKLIMFAGYGPEPLPYYYLVNGDFDFDNSSMLACGQPPAADQKLGNAALYEKGWNNDLLAYDITENKWISLANSGARPSTRAAHAMTAVGNTAFLFGGRHLMERLQDLYSLCLDTFQWTAINYKETSACPVGRSWHSLTASSDTQLFLFGGIDTARNMLPDSWIFDTTECAWRKAPVASHCRLWHSASLGTTREEIVIFGGCETSIFENTIHSDQILRLNIQPKALLRICLETLVLHAKTWKEKSDFLPKFLYRKLKKMSDDGG